MSTRMRKPVAGNTENYYKRLKKYFGFHLNGLEVREDGGEVQVQIVYLDFKHIDVVRKELAQMMPEVEFTKIRRDFTMSAERWVIDQMIVNDVDHPEPTIYVKRDNGELTLSSLWDIACAELRQLNLDDDEDKIPYDENERKGYDDDTLFTNAQD